ncbi:MAG: hypothetical protein WCU00_10150, partial [Candidatus Latescibacterota bacterium]
FIAAEMDDQTDDVITTESLNAIDSQIKTGIDSLGSSIPAVLQAQNLAGILDVFSSLIGGTYTVETKGGQSIQVNLSAFLNNGIPDLKTVLPYHTWADLGSIPANYSGYDISEKEFTINGVERKVYSLEVLEKYKQIVASYEQYSFLDGTFGADGSFTVNGRVTYTSTGAMTIEQLSGGAKLIDNGAVYLDSNKKLCFTESAWANLKAYTLAHPELYFNRVSEFQPLNFAIATPYGVCASNRIFLFAGRVSYAKTDNNPLVYLSDTANSGKAVTTPVFPDPTFGGLFPGMTSEEIMSLLTSSAS